MTYGSEAWVINKNMSQKLLSSEMMYWRRSLGLTLLDRVRNETIRQRMKANNTVIESIKERQLRWYGHLQRMSTERLPIKLWKWKPSQRRKQGRPRKRWKNDIQYEMELRGLKEGDWFNKDHWRKEQKLILQTIWNFHPHLYKTFYI